MLGILSGSSITGIERKKSSWNVTNGDLTQCGTSRAFDRAERYFRGTVHTCISPGKFACYLCHHILIQNKSLGSWLRNRKGVIVLKPWTAEDRYSWARSWEGRCVDATDRVPGFNCTWKAVLEGKLPWVIKAHKSSTSLNVFELYGVPQVILTPLTLWQVIKFTAIPHQAMHQGVVIAAEAG